MLRILVFGMTENPGGVESFLVNYYRHIDRNSIQLDFLCNSHEPVAYEEELLALGGRTFHITARSRNRALYRQELEKVFREHASEWKAIWVNVSSLANIDYLKIARRYGIPRRIIHSHNSQNMDSKLRGLLHKWNRLFVHKYATDFWACSEDAARWFYSEKLMERTVVIRNAIEVDRLSYDETRRRQIREMLGLKDEFVIGNVGRLHFQKNQSFMLDIYRAFLDRCPGSRLVLVGQGEDEQMLREKCAALKMTDRVIFAGVQKNVDAWLSAFDLFLFPSVFEGLSIAALEAQANGIPVLASEGVVPKDVRLNRNFVFCSLEQGPEKWAEKILEMQRDSVRLSPDEVKKAFTEKGYEIGAEAVRLERLLVE